MAGIGKKRGNLKYKFFNWVFSFLFFWIAYIAFLNTQTVNDATNVFDGILKFIIFYFICLLTGWLGAGLAAGISRYRGWMGGVGGIVRYGILNLVFVIFAFFGLKSLLFAWGLWAWVLYAGIKFATVGWADDLGLRAGLKAGHKFGGVH